MVFAIHQCDQLQKWAEFFTLPESKVFSMSFDLSSHCELRGRGQRLVRHVFNWVCPLKLSTAPRARLGVGHMEHSQVAQLKVACFQTSDQVLPTSTEPPSPAPYDSGCTSITHSIVLSYFSSHCCLPGIIKE